MNDDQVVADWMAEEVRAFAREVWAPDLTLRSWWAALANVGWAMPSWPEGCGGRGLDPAADVMVRLLLQAHGLIPPPDGLGQMLGGPVLLHHGEKTQIERFLWSLAAGLETWCQLFSEPSAGSDLASVRTSAIRDGDTWVVHGQKVWTSGAHLADRGLLLARTDGSAPKHLGMTFFILDMDQPGVKVRPLRDMSGHAFFSEVFIDGAIMADADRVGSVGDGWSVALTTLAFERAGLSHRRGIGPQADPIRPGGRSGFLDMTVGDLLAFMDMSVSSRSSTSAKWREPGRLVELARDRARSMETLLRQQLAGYHASFVSAELTRNRARHSGSPRLGPLGKLATSSLIAPSRDLAASLLGPEGMLMENKMAEVAEVAQAVLHSPAGSIAGGTDEVQRNIIGERVLGLPAEPRIDRHLPFREIPS